MVIARYGGLRGPIDGDGWGPSLTRYWCGKIHTSNRTGPRALISQGSFPEVPRLKPPLTELVYFAPNVRVSVVVFSLPD